MSRFIKCCLLPLLVTVSQVHAEDGEFPKMPFVPPLSVEDAAKSFLLPDGYRLEPVLSEPVIKEPVLTVFDANGRMFVAEMRTYMQDIDGNNQREKTSRISMHEDTNGDGKFDRHTVFVDNLVLPRMILPLGKGQIVVNETDTLDLYLYTDTDGDGVADKKELWWEGGPRGGNLEHQPSGLVWAMDNAIYTTYNTFRLRWTPQGIKQEATAPNNGQWGLGHADDGSLYYVNAGGELGPVSFQAPVVYGMFNPQEQLAPGFKEVFPAIGARDMQGGPNRVREPDGTLNYVTSGAGIDVYRGDQLPKELLGDVFFGEPVGRLVRRANVHNEEGMKVLVNPYQEERSEFLRSKDLYFKPVNVANAPDGTLYITDMYRGIIQEAAWVNEGSYLRKVVEQYDFDKVVGHGRIWRLVHTSTKRMKSPRMYEETARELVVHLQHPNGWWRDMAQRQLILRQDRSIVPLLERVARLHKNPITKMHALWTLQGLDALEPALVREKMKDKDAQVRAAAIRVSESLFRAGDASFREDIMAMAKDPSPEVVLQACYTAKYLAWPEHMDFIEETILDSNARGVRKIGEAIMLPSGQKPAEFSEKQMEVMKKGEEIYATLCAACHGNNGKGIEVEGLAGRMLAPPIAGAKSVVSSPNGSVYILLKGLQGEIEGKEYEGLMVAMDSNDDDWIASVVSYIRNDFGNRGSFVTPEDVAIARKKTAHRKTPWTYDELMALLPHPIDTGKMKVTASAQPHDASKAIDGNHESRYTTGTFMKPGMWFQVELEERHKIVGLVLDTSNSANDYPRSYEVLISEDGEDWGKPIARGFGDGPVTEIEFPETSAKYIRIVQTGEAQANYWSIHDFQVLQAPQD